MPSPLRRAALLGTVLSAVLAAPAAAATIPVAPGGVDSQCSRGGTQPCKTLTRAESLAQAGDTISLAAGLYVEPAPLVVDVADLRVTGAGTSSVVVTDPANAGGPTIAFEEDARLAELLVLKSAGSGAAVAAEASLDLDRVDALSLVGAALAIVSPAAGDGSANAVSADSSLFSAAAGAYGVDVSSPAPALGASTADDVALTLRHVTVAGPAGAKGISLDASDANGCAFPVPSCLSPGSSDPAANMTATLSDSILDGESVTAANPGGAGVAPNTAKIVFSGKNLADAVTGTSEGAPTGAADAAALFWDPQQHVYLLRPGAAAAIDAGGADPAGDEPALDLFGDPRKSGAATDLGADEYVNQAPAAALGASKENPLIGETVTFTATASDAEAAVGGGIVKYYWTFGDGTHAVTDTATTTHAYATEGDKDVKLAVEDAQGAFSEIVTRRIVVSPVPDVAAPEVQILQPKQGQVLKLKGKRRKGKRRPLQLSILGGVKDATGIRQVDVALRLVKRKRGARPGAGRCEFYGGKRRFRKTSCDEPVWLKASRTRNVWRLRTPKGWRVPAGRYELRARATDILGNVSREFDRAAKTLVAFRVK